MRSHSSRSDDEKRSILLASKAAAQREKRGGVDGERRPSIERGQE